MWRRAEIDQLSRHIASQFDRDHLMVGVIVLVAILIGIGIAVMLHDAFKSSSVVIEPFESPPILAARGMMGKVVASGLLDELTRIQDASHGSAAQFKRRLANAWSNDVKVAVPKSGISIGEISRLLQARFGHDLHIGGSLVQTTSGGLALSVRGDKVVAKTFTGDAEELDKLVVDAAEYVCAQSQPVLWASYLGQAGRYREAISFITSVYAAIDPEYRPYLFNTWCVSFRSSLEVLRPEPSPHEISLTRACRPLVRSCGPDRPAPHGRA
jgi:hypothetical protein